MLPKRLIRFISNRNMKNYSMIVHLYQQELAKQKVILLLSDGLRWDRFRVDVPNLDEIEKNGVRADWLDGVFITMTMPSTYSIATGKYSYYFKQKGLTFSAGRVY